MTDTGAELNVMPREIYDKLEDPPEIKGATTQLKDVVEGQATSIAGTIRIKPQIAGWDLPEANMRVPEGGMNVSVPI